MTARIRWFLTRLTANYWFYPALFTVLAVTLASVCLLLDRSGAASFLEGVEWLVPARPESAKTMLQVIAGSMIAVASTVFSITIVAVSYASSTYGPRLLTNFMEDKGNQLSLATFIATFAFALTVLHFVRAREERTATAAGEAASALAGFVPQLSLLVTYALTALAVGVLVYFLNHVPSAIRINNVLSGIGRRLIAGIESTYPEKGGDERMRGERPGGTPVTVESAGYVQLIGFTQLARLAQDRDCTITLLVRTGDFLHPGMDVALVDCAGDAEPGELAGRVREQLTLGAARTPDQDPQFLIDELVEIGLRALSPGINDPFTAITALHWLGAATAELGQRRLEKNVAQGKDGTRRVYPLPDDFAHYLARGFAAIRGAVATSPIAASVMLGALEGAAETIADKDRRAMLRAEAVDLMRQARLELGGPDLAMLEERFTAFNRETSPGD